MRGQTAIAQRYLSLLRRWRRLRRRAIRGSPSWEMVSLDSEVRALGWVLGADPRDGLGQPYGGTEMTVDGKPRVVIAIPRHHARVAAVALPHGSDAQAGRTGVFARFSRRALA